MKNNIRKTFEKVVTTTSNNKPFLLAQVELNKTHKLVVESPK